jgi:multidrug efflux pump
VQDAYGRSLRVVLAHRPHALLVSGTTLALTVLLYVSIPKGFFPTQDTGLIQGITQAAPATSFPRMARLQQDAARVVLADPAVAGVASFIGADGINTTLNSGRLQISLAPLAARHAPASAVIDRLQRALDAVPGIAVSLQPVQDLTVDDRVTRTQYQYTLEDPNAQELAQVLHDLTRRMRDLPEVRHVVTDQQPGGQAVVLTIDRATASRYGITPASIDDALYDAYGQRQVATMYTQVNQYHVILEAEPAYRRDPARLADLYLQSASGPGGSAGGAPASGRSGSGASSTAIGPPLLTPAVASSLAYSARATAALPGTSPAPAVPAATGTSALAPGNVAGSTTTVVDAGAAALAATMSANTAVTGTTRPPLGGGAGSAGGSAAAPGGAIAGSSLPAPVPLRAFTKVQRGSEALAVTRQGQFPAATISFDLAPGISLGQAEAALDRTIAAAHLPASVIASYQGAAAAFASASRNQGLLVLAALVTVYIVLGVLYESFIHPITILSTLPSAGLGALLALRLTRTDLDIVAIIGIILLIGIVQKNGIMMVDFGLELQRRHRRTAEEAIYQASVLRFRPILMTTLAALLSGLPLAFGTGIGSELRRPLGIAMVGGLIVSQVLTLYTTPVIYIFFAQLAERCGFRIVSPGAPLPSEAPPAHAGPAGAAAP